jgi:alpha-D-ribose 1-methylphosphonate 5-triphosphate synthase subunit PhnI
MRKADERRVGLIEPYAGALRTGIVNVIAAQYHHMGHAISVNVTERRMIEKVSASLTGNRD